MNNENTTREPIGIGLVAGREMLAPLSHAIAASPHLRLVAQSGMRPEDALPHVPLHDDVRVLLAAGGVQAVIVGLSTRSAAEVAELAMERNVHVWHLPPIARSFSEACEHVRRARNVTAILRVASWWETEVDAAWHDLHWPESFRPHFSDVSVAAAGPQLESWRAHGGEAAGGVLAADGYPMLEALVAARGLPESTAGAIFRFRRHANGTISRETEDVAVAILRYGGGGTAVVRATWDLPPAECRLLHHDARTTVELTQRQISLRSDGVRADERVLPQDFLRREMARFADVVRSAARDLDSTALERHLAVSALLDAIYLSARTSQPESPRKFYEVQNWPEPPA